MPATFLELLKVELGVLVHVHLSEQLVNALIGMSIVQNQLSDHILEVSKEPLPFPVCLRLLEA